MVTIQNRRIPSDILQADEDAVVALRAIDNYQPSDPTCTLEAITADLEAMHAAQDAETLGQHAQAARRDANVAAQWKFHNTALRLKDQVIAQFGPNSDEVASLGLKKKSERKARSRSKKASA